VQTDLPRDIIQGYSYGGVIALATILKEPSSLRPEIPTSLVLISYPASVAWALTLGHSPASLPPPEIPVMCVYGSNDQFSSRTTYRKWWARLGDGSVASHHRALLCIPHADHIWMGMEARLAGEIDGWLSLLSSSE
jgi:dienelactone hydrolase